MTIRRLKLTALSLACMLTAGLSALPANASCGQMPRKSKVVRAGKGKVHKPSDKDKSDGPDFAFPQTVIDKAESAMRQASGRGDETAVIRNAIQIVTANNLISTDRMPAMAMLLDSLAKKGSPAGASILYSLEAQLYRQVYTSDRYTFDRRTLPLDSYPEDPQLWSTQLFAKKVLELTDKSLTCKKDLQSSSSAHWKTLLTDTSDHALDFYPTLYSILANRSIDLLKTFAGNRTVIPFGAAEQKSTPSQQCAMRADAIASEWNGTAKASGNVAEMTVTLPRTLENVSSGHRVKAYLEAYKENKSSPYSTEFINDAYLNSGEDARNLLPQLKECVATHSDYFRINTVKNAIVRLEEGSGVLNMDNLYSSRQDVEVKVSAARMPEQTYACLFRIPADKQGLSYGELIRSPQTRFISSQIIPSGTGQPDTCMLNFGKLPVGKYLLAVGNDAKGTFSQLYKDYNVFKVTDIALTTVSSGNYKEVLVTNSLDGKPLAGVTARFTRDRKGKSESAITDADGLVRFPTAWTDNGYVDCVVTRGDDTASLSEWLSQRKHENSPSLQALILTDLSLFHPGDTCRFAAIVYERNPLPKQNTPKADLPLKAILYNASNVPCDTLALTTGKDGRAIGEFKLPEEGMNGVYNIALTSGDLSDSNQKRLATSFIRVEQYKQPSFLAELDPVENIIPGNELKVTGKVVTYSGMPVANADVRLNFNSVPLWWFSEVDGSYTADTRTNGEGRFSISLHTERLNDTAFSDMYYRVQADATSEAGETQQSGFRNFYIGKSLQISYNGKGRIDADTEFITLPFDVIGGNGDRQSLSYTITDAKGKVIVSGESETPDIRVNSDLFPSGTYKVQVKADEGSTALCTTVTLYRASDTVTPCESALWTPITVVDVPADAKEVSIPVGSSSQNYIFYITSDINGITDKGFVHPQGGISHIKAKAPQSRNERAWVLLCTTDSCNSYTSRIELIPAAAKESVKVEKISFRDNISAGGRERWTFRFTLADKGLADIPVVATLSDKSLNAIYPFSWNTIPESYFYNPLSLNPEVNRYRLGMYISHPYGKTLSVPDLYTPDINTYGRNLYGSYYNGRVYFTTAMNSSSDLLLEEEAVADYAAPHAPEPMMRSSLKKESAAESMAMGAAADTGAADMDGSDVSAEENVKFRPAEMPLAWFKPNLSTDADGVVEISFTAPDFNTTWQLQMLGYNYEMLTALTREDVTASKPVMVSANTPRFLRTGDKVTLMATVYNNSDKQADVSAGIEIFDPLTGNTIVSRDFSSEEVSANGSRVIGIDFSAPSDIQFVGYKVYGKVPGFSDGEQSLIAVLPSSSPVTETEPFYLAPARDSYEITLPEFDKNAQVSLQYCDNPVWECVTALPDMSYDKNASILSVANSMYGNAIAAGLVRTYPQLGEAIRLWNETGDSTLVSKLQRDPQLKIVALDNTPWVNNAQAETLRMSRLTNLLDDANCKAAIEDALNRLVAEQKGGGWSWCKGMEPSEYITAQVLWRLGMLRQMGFLPEEKRVQNMVASALKFCDKELYKEYLKCDKHFNTSSMLNYIYIRSFFPEVPMSGDFASLKKAALKAVKAEWKDFGIYDKATAATLLYREKEPMLARTILESLNQFASKSEERGMWFDNLRSGFFTDNTLITTAQALEAFHEITPKSPSIDLLRQWLIIERQAQDWGSDAQLAEVIYAVLSTGSDWTVFNEPARVYLGGKELHPAGRDRLTGSFTMLLNATEASGSELRIVKSGKHQAWGGIVAKYISPIEDVKEFSESDVTVSKRILTVEQDGDGTEVRPLGKNDSVAIGQRLRVQLTVTSERDIDYAVITDERGGCMALADQLSHFVWQDGTGFYREVRDGSTNFFLPRLPKGDFILEYDCFAGQEGTFSIGIATLQSLYAPSLSAHSAGAQIQVHK